MNMRMNQIDMSNGAALAHSAGFGGAQARGLFDAAAATLAAWMIICCATSASSVSPPRRSARAPSGRRERGAYCTTISKLPFCSAPS